MLGLIQIPPNQCQQIGRCFVATWKAAIQCFQVPPAHGSFNVLNASPLFEKSPEGFAVQGVARFEFANGQLGLGHGVSQHRLNLRNRGPPLLWRARSMLSSTRQCNQFLLLSLLAMLQPARKLWLG